MTAHITKLELKILQLEVKIDTVSNVPPPSQAHMTATVNIIVGPTAEPVILLIQAKHARQKNPIIKLKQPYIIEWEEVILNVVLLQNDSVGWTNQAKIFLN